MKGTGSAASIAWRRLQLAVLTVTATLLMTLVAGNGAVAAISEITPNYMPNPRPVGALPVAGDSLQQLDFGAATGDTHLLGVEFDGTNYWVTGGNSGNDPNYLYKLSAAGALLATYAQPAGCTNWGGRDLAFDGSHLYFGCDDGLIHQIDPATGTEVGTIPAPFAPPRALAYDPATDHFWTSNWDSAIYEIDRTGATVNSFPPVGLSTYGMAWDSVSPGGPYLWLWSQDGATLSQASQLNPDTGALTGVSFAGVDFGGSMAGGATFSTAVIPGKGVLVGMHQAPSDTVVIYEIVNVCTVGVYAAADLPWITDVQNKLIGTGLFARVDVHDVRGYTPTLAELQGYGSILVFSDWPYADNVAMGNVMADYMDAGGGVVMSTFSYGGAPISGRIVSANFLPFLLGGVALGTPLSLVPDLIADPILAGVNTFNGGSGSWHNIVPLAPGATQIAHWTNGRPLVAKYQPTTGKIVGLNFYPPSSDARSDFWDAATDGDRLMANALNWAGNCAVIANTFTVTPSAGANGSISPSTPVTVNANETTSFTITPDTGYHIDTVGGTCGGTLDTNTSTFTTNPVTADCSVDATFAIDSFTVTPSAGSNGTISPNTPQTVNYNSTTSFTVTPSLGYYIGTVAGCGGTTYTGTTASTGAITYTTGAITADCQVNASFSRLVASAPPSLAVVPPSIPSVYPMYLSMTKYAAVNWAASQTPSTTYELQVSINGGSFRTIYQGTNLAWRGVVYKGAYVFRVRANKKDYQSSDWLTSNPMLVR